MTSKGLSCFANGPVVTIALNGSLCGIAAGNVFITIPAGTIIIDDDDNDGTVIVPLFATVENGCCDGMGAVEKERECVLIGTVKAVAGKEGKGAMEGAKAWLRSKGVDWGC